MRELKWLLLRDLYSIRRNPKVFKARMIQGMFIGFLVLVIFWDLSFNTMVEQRDLIGALFFVTMNMMMITIMPTLIIF